LASIAVADALLDERHYQFVQGSKALKAFRRPPWLLSDSAGIALCRKIHPRYDLGMLLKQSPALALGHAAPNPELDLVVERLRPALCHHRAATADDRSLTLFRPPHKECVGIYSSTQRLRGPSAIVRGHAA